MPWLSLAILLIVALTIAALALILFPPGEVRDQAVEGDITVGADEVASEEDAADDVDAQATADDLTPPSADGDRHPRAGTRLRGGGEDAPSQAGASVASAPPPGRNLQS
jgi:hypothetical protein